MAKLQKAYAERMGKPFTAIRFVFDGQRINDEDTAESMGMEDGDEIDAMNEQVVSRRAHLRSHIITMLIMLLTRLAGRRLLSFVASKLKNYTHLDRPPSLLVTYHEGWMAGAATCLLT